MTITRIFRVRIHEGLAQEFEPAFASISVSAVDQAEGNQAVEILRPTLWAPDEYAMISRWESEAALAKFAGVDWNVAVIPAGMERFVADCSVYHYRSWDE